MKLILSGMMATGKSTLGSAAANSLGLPFFDTDAMLVAETGFSVAELFRNEGEARFREREATCILHRLQAAGPAVIAVGGGALLSRTLRHEVLERAAVVRLRASEGTICERLARDSADAARPLLQGCDLPGRVHDLVALREPTYAEAHAQLSTDAASFADTAAALVALYRQLGATRPVCIPLAQRSYNVYCVHRAYHMLTEALSALRPSRVIVVSDANVAHACDAYIRAALAQIAAPITQITVAPGETTKVVPQLATLWDAILDARPDRDAVIVALGGGVVGDLAGFAAATSLRGLRAVQVPTTLLAMLDSSVGGKTGVDHVTGKNRIGAMHQPSSVVCDTGHLASLPVRELRAGLAELIKVAAVSDLELFEDLERAGAALCDPLYAEHTTFVRRGVIAKMRFVRDDELELGARRMLNFGHTIGHALESATQFETFLHGEAVALGIGSELALGVECGITTAACAERVVALLTEIGLSTRARQQDLHAAAQLLRGDKKLRGDAIDMPWMTALGSGTVSALPVEQLQAFLQR